MPKKVKKPGFNKNILITIAILILGMVIYINRSYARIFDYDKFRDILTVSIQREYELSGGEGTESLKYVVMGDSLTYGFGAGDYTETYPYVLARDFLKEYKQVKVVNLAVPGSTTSEIITGQLPKAIEERPQLVTLMTGTNDVHDFIDKESFRTDLEFIVDELKKISAKVLLINIPYLGTKDLILPPHNVIMDARIREYNKIIQEVSEKKHVEYFDIYTASGKYFKENPEEYYSLDQFHPSAKGYILWGELINAN